MDKPITPESHVDQEAFVPVRTIRLGISPAAHQEKLALWQKALLILESPQPLTLKETQTLKDWHAQSRVLLDVLLGQNHTFEREMPWDDLALAALNADKNNRPSQGWDNRARKALARAQNNPAKTE